jgi:hypothetical protein
MNEERIGKCLQMEHIRGHLWHRYSIAVNQVMVMTIKLWSDDFNLTKRYSVFSFICMFCRSLFFFFWPLCCLFCDLRILITSLWYLQTILTGHPYIADLYLSREILFSTARNVNAYIKDIFLERAYIIRRFTQVLQKGKRSLLHWWHTSC